MRMCVRASVRTYIRTYQLLHAFSSLHPAYYIPATQFLTVSARTFRKGGCESRVGCELTFVHSSVHTSVHSSVHMFRFVDVSFFLLPRWPQHAFERNVKDLQIFTFSALYDPWRTNTRWKTNKTKTWNNCFWKIETKTNTILQNTNVRISKVKFLWQIMYFDNFTSLYDPWRI